MWLSSLFNVSTSSSGRFSSQSFSVFVFLLISGWWVFLIYLFVFIHFVLIFCDPAGFILSSTRRSIFLHAMVVWPISRTILQLIEKHHLLERRYKTKHQILTTEQLFLKITAWCISSSGKNIDRAGWETHKSAVERLLRRTWKGSNSRNGGMAVS